MPFTVQGYFEHHKLSKVQLYIACRPQVDEEDTDDEALMTSPFSQSDKGRKWRQNLPLESESVKPDSRSWASENNGDASHWRNVLLENERKLKAEQDKEYQEPLEIDLRKRKALEEEMSEVSRLEDIRRVREARVPQEPQVDADVSTQVRIVVQHPSQGRVTRFFSAQEKMLAVYDCIGSLDIYPEHFSLHVQPADAISPQDGVLDFQGVVIFVETLHEPLPLSFSSLEVSFKGFDTIEPSVQVDSGESSAFQGVEAVSEEVPHQRLEDDEPR